MSAEGQERDEERPRAAEPWAFAAMMGQEGAAIRVSATLADLSARFFDAIAPDMARLRAIAVALREEDEELLVHYRAAFRIAHDLKGQGAVFGCGLMTSVAALLCELLRTDHEGPPPPRARVLRPIEALLVIADKRIKGDGGPLGAKLLAQLRAHTS